MFSWIGRGVEDAKLIILDKVFIHLEKPTARAKILFANFSLAFNLMQHISGIQCTALNITKVVFNLS